MLDYIRDPDLIYQQSFATIQSEVGEDLARLPEDLAVVAVRLIHACGMTDVVRELVASADAIARGRAALAAGAPIFCDVEMVAHGISPRYLRAHNPIICTLNHESVPARSKQINNTRSATAVELWLDQLEGSVVAIGNAPTALFHLLELLDQGAPKPALILGFPVGFVGAVESKAALAADSRGVPYLTLLGRRGGSAIAAAAVNGLAQGNFSNS
jgi:precorrin-8X/cobalt-precorrin-8 methylmutase